jgi:inorganic pyrophosphatase/exopolyphosphatase
MIIVTSGGAYTDIDAYAGCVAYAELLRLGGEDAEAVLEPRLNASITPYLRSLSARYLKAYEPNNNDVYVIIDTSEEGTFAPFVVHERIREVIDHHPGFERYWADQSHVKAQIEIVGAACTQVFERWGDVGRLKDMSTVIAELLMAGILDNTLGLKAHITTPRDIEAYRKLQELAGDSGTFIERYFEDCQKQIETDITDAVRNDIKTPTYPRLGIAATGQLAVWDGNETIQNHLDDIRAAMGSDEKWLFNLISISEGKSSFISNDEILREYFASLLGTQFDERDVAEADRLWLRKEIMKAAIDAFPER